MGQKIKDIIRSRTTHSQAHTHTHSGCLCPYMGRFIPAPWCALTLLFSLLCSAHFALRRFLHFRCTSTGCNSWQTGGLRFRFWLPLAAVLKRKCVREKLGEWEEWSPCVRVVKSQDSTDYSKQTHTFTARSITMETAESSCIVTATEEHQMTKTFPICFDLKFWHVFNSETVCLGKTYERAERNTCPHPSLQCFHETLKTKTPLSHTCLGLCNRNFILKLLAGHRSKELCETRCFIRKYADVDPQEED